MWGVRVWEVLASALHMPLKPAVFLTCARLLPWPHPPLLPLPAAPLLRSVPVTPLVSSCPNYAVEPIMWDAPFRQQLLDGLVELGYAVEHAFDGTPQVRRGQGSCGQSGPRLLWAGSKGYLRVLGFWWWGLTAVGLAFALPTLRQRTHNPQPESRSLMTPLTAHHRCGGGPRFLWAVKLVSQRGIGGSRFNVGCECADRRRASQHTHIPQPELRTLNTPLTAHHRCLLALCSADRVGPWCVLTGWC